VRDRLVLDEHEVYDFAVAPIVGAGFGANNITQDSLLSRSMSLASCMATFGRRQRPYLTLLPSSCSTDQPERLNES
jgi:hypothetical protein